MSEFKQILLKVVGDPDFIPPENFMDLDLTSLETILKGCSKEVCVKFAVDEARLVLSIFESTYPKDDRPRKAIEAAEAWLNKPGDVSASASFYAAAVAIAAIAAATNITSAANTAVRAVTFAAFAAAYTGYTVGFVYHAADADAVDAAYHAAYHADAASVCDISLRSNKLSIEQLRHLFDILRSNELSKTAIIE